MHTCEYVSEDREEAGEGRLRGFSGRDQRDGMRGEWEEAFALLVCVCASGACGVCLSAESTRLPEAARYR